MMEIINIGNVLDKAKTIAGKPTNKDVKKRKSDDEFAKKLNNIFTTFTDSIINNIEGWDYGKDTKSSSFRPGGNDSNPYKKYNWRFFKPQNTKEQDKCLLIIYVKMIPLEDLFMISIGIHDNRNKTQYRNHPIPKDELVEIYEYISQLFQNINMQNHHNFELEKDGDNIERNLSYKKNLDETSETDFVNIFKDLIPHYEQIIDKYENLTNDVQGLDVQELVVNSKISTIINHINTPSNFILYGPPGTGKTYKTVDISASIIGGKNENIKDIDDIIDYDKDNEDKEYEKEFHESNTNMFNNGLNSGQIHFVTFHQNYSYEEFVGGLRPVIDNDENKGNLQFQWKPGIFIKACAKALELARKDEDEINDEKERIKWFLNECENFKKDDFDFSDKAPKVVLVIDEINRANISRVFGELITLIEDDKRIGGAHQLILTLPNGDKKFGVPKNLIIMGTMNTADKSLALLDVALRRRFEFKGLFPKEELIENQFREILKTLNEDIRQMKGVDYQIGHSYFMGGEKKNDDFLKNVFNKKIIPLLNEYFMNDRKKIKGLVEKVVAINDKVFDKYGVVKCSGVKESNSTVDSKAKDNGDDTTS